MGKGPSGADPTRTSQKCWRNSDVPRVRVAVRRGSDGRKVITCKGTISALELESKKIDENTNKRIAAMEISYNEEKKYVDRKERESDLRELSKQEQMYMNAQTKQGKDKLKQIRDEIDQFNKQNYEEDRQKEIAEEKERIEAQSEEKKRIIEEKKKDLPAAYGLQQDDQGNFSKAANFDEVIKGQQTFQDQSRDEISQYNKDISDGIVKTTQNVSDSHSSTATAILIDYSQLMQFARLVNFT